MTNFYAQGLADAINLGNVHSEMESIKTLLKGTQDAFEEALAQNKNHLRYDHFHNYTDILRYPYDLMINPNFQTFMRIYIHEPDATALQTKRTIVNVDNAAEDVLDTIQNFINASVGEGLVAAEDTENLNKSDGIVDRAVRSAGKAIIPFAAGIRNYITASGGPRENYVLNPGKTQDINAMRSWVEEETGIPVVSTVPVKSIYLYIPGGLDFSYGMDYEDSNMAGMDVLKLPNALANKNIDPNVSQEIAKKIGFANLKLLNKVTDLIPGFSGEWDKFMSAQQRQVVNPVSLHLFKEVKRREFTFPYVFLPRNREEMRQVHKIINAFKYYAHPERSSSGRFLDYPAEFKISFLQADSRNGIQNMYLPQIMKSVLKGIKVKYGEDTSFSTFSSDGDPMGSAPTKITMELTFGELEILTRERFADPDANPEEVSGA